MEAEEDMKDLKEDAPKTNGQNGNREGAGYLDLLGGDKLDASQAPING